MKHLIFVFFLHQVVCLSTGLYGLSNVFAPNFVGLQLFQVSPTTGLITNISSPVQNAVQVWWNFIFNKMQSQQLSSIDQNGGIFYFVAWNVTDSPPKQLEHVIGISLSNGSVVKNIQLPLFVQSFFGAEQSISIDNQQNQILVSGNFNHLFSNFRTASWLSPQPNIHFCWHEHWKLENNHFILFELNF